MRDRADGYDCWRREGRGRKGDGSMGAWRPLAQWTRQKEVSRSGGDTCPASRCWTPKEVAKPVYSTRPSLSARHGENARSGRGGPVEGDEEEGKVGDQDDSGDRADRYGCWGRERSGKEGREGVRSVRKEGLLRALKSDRMKGRR